MVLAMIALAAATPLHFVVSYEVVDVRAGDRQLAQAICIRSSGVDESLMSDEQRRQRDDVLRRVDRTWAAADWRGRARLALALAEAESVAPRSHEFRTDARFLLPDEHVVRVGLHLANPTSSDALVVEDLDSGQYLFVSHLGQPSQLPELLAAAIGNFFRDREGAKRDPAAEAEALRRAKEEAERVAAKTSAVAEVNGQREFLPDGATADDIAHALAAMWDNLDGEPRERIGWCLAVLGAMESLRPEKVEDLMDWPNEMEIFASVLRFGCLPIPPAPEGLRLRKTNDGRHGIMRLAPPPDEVIKPYFGDRGWRPPDFSLSFPAQVRRLLRGDRD